MNALLIADAPEAVEAIELDQSTTLLKLLSESETMLVGGGGVGADWG